MPNILTTIADRVLGGGVKLSYGEPIILSPERSMVPVALVNFGFGGGGDESDNGGGGGGGTVIPLGVYASDAAGTRFQPNPVVMLALAVPALAILGWTIVKLTK